MILQLPLLSDRKPSPLLFALATDSRFTDTSELSVRVMDSGFLPRAKFLEHSDGLCLGLSPTRQLVMMITGSSRYPRLQLSYDILPAGTAKDEA